ncbi:uncharacterized protein LOC125232999 [Leguminivora glycinivorella]|uniref:uncharacterized protein LOC125232999 n=1 Tax=Leguminivora glycinivorella TaxID=1035111 RepID=UPI00201044A8|nr:uncharacterized protein LOC125232999 [Leguminivora glycinivorella]
MWNSEKKTKALKLALPDYGTVYLTELLAIHQVTKIVSNHQATTFGIYSDSMAALQTVTNHSCIYPLAVESRKNIREISLQNRIISIFLIKAHAELEGNERADQLAKEAATKSKKRPDYDLCPISFVKRSIRMATLDKWNHIMVC